ncbi:MAG: ABC transporter ATP-binding protein [Bacteriovoracaceae bacterium]|jgi:ATP-binding cassette, subfamily B, multidrug efflux pump|nr:ABC transporter ATP-binding protein [Bacteriovoracaceae bacterium]
MSLATQSSHLSQSTPYIKKEARKLWTNFIWKNKTIYLIGIAMVMLTNAMQVFSTRLMGWILDFFTNQKIPNILSGNSKWDTFYKLFWFLLAARVITTIGRWGWRITLARQTHRASSMLRTNIWDNVRFFHRNDLDKFYTKGVLMNASTSDVNSGRFIFGFTLVAVVDVVFLGILSVATMLSIHVPMTLLSLVVMTFLPIVVNKLSKLEITKYEIAQNTLSNFNDLSSQVIATIRLQRLTQTGDYWEKRLNGSGKDYQEKRYHLLKTSLRYIPIMGGASILSYIVLFSLGIHLVTSSKMSVGDFVAMQGLIFLLQDPLMELGFIISELRKGFTSLERLSRIFHNEIDNNLTSDGAIVDDHKEILNIKKLSFRFKEKDKFLFKDLNLTLKHKDRLGITGSIGSGKSILINILSGIQRNFDGEVSLAGKDFDDYSHSELRKYISQVHQKPFLFAESIKNNIAMDQDITDDEIWRILEISGLKNDVANFDNGIETSLGEWGVNLSGGQKQRLTLARALSRKPKLLFLDDCLSAVDTITEEKILQNLDKELVDTTLVWVAHRKSTLKYCNKYLHLGDKHE